MEEGLRGGEGWREGEGREREGRGRVEIGRGIERNVEGR